MTTVVIVVSMALGIIWGATGMVVYLVTPTQERRQVNRTQRKLARAQRRVEKLKQKEGHVPRPDLHTIDGEGFAPLAIDPSNPPQWRYYRPKGSNTKARRTCHCHNKPITVDQKILWWPLPDGSVRLLCEEAEMKGIDQ